MLPIELVVVELELVPSVDDDVTAPGDHPGASRADLTKHEPPALESEGRVQREPGEVYSSGGSSMPMPGGMPGIPGGAPPGGLPFLSSADFSNLLGAAVAQSALQDEMA